MRIGIIGTRWGRMHIGGFRGAGDEIAALCGLDAARTAEVAAAEGIAMHTTDVAALCAAVDVVVVASPDALHGEHVRVAIDAGRHVLCEKPLTRTAEEAAALVQHAARASGRVCAVNFPYRMLPPLQALAAWLRERGPVRSCTVHVRSGFVARTAASDGPMLGDSGDFGGVSHVLDAALWLIGSEPRAVQAWLVGRPVHDVGPHLELDDGAALHLAHVAAVAPGIAGTWHLVGDDWEVRFVGGYEPALGGWQVGPVLAATRTQGWFELAPAVSPVAGRREPWAEAHVTTARALLAAIAGDSRAALASLADGARVQAILGAAMQSQTEGRRVALLTPRAGRPAA